MTVLDQTTKVTGNGNGAATVFSFSPLVIFQSSDIQVTHVAVDGTETLLTEGTGSANYSVSVSSYPGTGSITYPADAVTPMATGESVVMKRVLVIEQTVELQNQGGYFPDIHETEYDKITMILLQLQEELDRCVQVEIGSTTNPADLISQLTTDASNASASATAAATSETNAAASATAAASSASQAQAAAASIGFSDVVFVTSAQSPIAIAAADSGKLYSVDTSGGNVVVNLPKIAGLVLPFTLGVTKTTADVNTVTINTDAADDFVGGATSKVIDTQFGTTLIPDVDPNPDAWSACDWAGVAISDGSITTAKLADGAVTTVKLDSGVATVPTGAIFWFPCTAAPTGYLSLDGSAVNRTTYANLWTFAQASGNITASDAAWTGSEGMFSPGDGSTTFRLPDLRGEFIRGFDGGRGVDSGRTFGSRQADAFKSHTHTIPVTAQAPASGSGNTVNSSGTTPTGATGDTETRPRNIAYLPCIKT